MLTYNLSLRGSSTKSEYLTACIKNDILCGKLSAGARLPSKRSLAEHLGISVVTVEAAYAQLQDEGYISSKERSGFFVCRLQLPTEKPGTGAAAVPSAGEPSGRESSGDRPGRALPSDEALLRAKGEHDGAAAGSGTGPSTGSEGSGTAAAPAFYEEPMDPGFTLSPPEEFSPEFRTSAETGNGTVPDFPFTPFLRIVREVLNDYREKLIRRPPNAGTPELREAVSSYLNRYRGMNVRPEQVIIGSGSEYLYGLVAQLFDRRVVYAIEGQSYEKIRLVYSAYARPYELLPMDEYGVSTEGLKSSQAGVLHVTPFHSYPTGITAPAAKRYEYLAWARARKAFIVEDDFESEFSVQHKPLETMYSMDGTGSVIYLNTFTKSLAPSMRVGYMVLPERLLDGYRQKLGFYSCTVPSLDQYVLAEYMNRGYFEQRLNHIRRKLKAGAAL